MRDVYLHLGLATEIIIMKYALAALALSSFALATPATAQEYVVSPTVTYYAPSVSYYAPSVPVTTYYAPAAVPVTSYYYAPAPAYGYYAAPAYYYSPRAARRAWRNGFYW
jgi:hypothetical protein